MECTEAGRQALKNGSRVLSVRERQIMRLATSDAECNIKLLEAMGAEGEHLVRELQTRGFLKVPGAPEAVMGSFLDADFYAAAKPQSAEERRAAEEALRSLSYMTAHAAAMAPVPEAQPAAPDAADSSPVRSAKATQLYLQAMLRTLAQPRAEELALQIGAASEPIDLLRAFTEGAGYFLRMAGEERAGHMRTKLRDILPLEYTQRMASLLKDD